MQRLKRFQNQQSKFTAWIGHRLFAALIPIENRALGAFSATYLPVDGVAEQQVCEQFGDIAQFGQLEPVHRLVTVAKQLLEVLLILLLQTTEPLQTGNVTNLNMIQSVQSPPGLPRRAVRKISRRSSAGRSNP